MTYCLASQSNISENVRADLIKNGQGSDAIGFFEGTGLSGSVYNAACYVIHDPDFGWIALGGRLTSRGDKLRVEPRDAARRKIVVRELDLKIESPNRPIGYVRIDTITRAADAYDEQGRKIDLAAQVRSWQKTPRGSSVSG